MRHIKYLVYLLIFMSFLISPVFLLVSCWDDGVSQVESVEELKKLSFRLASDSIQNSLYDSSEIVATGDTLIFYADIKNRDEQSDFKEVVDSFSLFLRDSSGIVLQNSIHLIADTADTAVINKLFIGRLTIDTVGEFTFRVISHTSDNAFLGDTASIDFNLGRKPLADTSGYPKNLTILTDGTLTLEVGLKEGSAPEFQWFKDSVLLKEKTSAILIINNLQTSNSGKYHCIVSNLWGAFSTDLVNISVINNRAPVWKDTIQPFVISEGQPLQIDFHTLCEDPDGDSLLFSFIDTPSLNGKITGSIFNYKPTFSDSGHYTLKIKASDSVMTDSTDIEIQVINVNRAPLWNVESVIAAIDENVSLLFSFREFVNDPDSDSLIISLDSSTFDGNIFTGAVISNDTLKMITDYSSAGDYLFYLSASDGVVSTEKQFTLKVNGINRVPIWATHSAIPAVNETDSVVFDIKSFVSDPDGDSVTIRLDSIILGGYVFTRAAFTMGALVMSTDFSSAGDYTFYFHASDGSLSATTFFTLRVEETNRSPIWADTSIIPAVDEMDSLLFDVETLADDPDNDNVIIHLDSTTFNGNIFTGAVIEDGTIKMSTDYSSAGDYIFYLNASDNYLSTVKQFTLTVNDINAAPVWSDTSIIPSVKENMSVSFDTRAFVSDFDDDSVTITLDSSIFEGNIFNGAVLSNDTILIQANHILAGDYIFYLSASDNLLSTAKQFTLKAAGANRAPIWSDKSIIDSIDETVSLSFDTRTSVDDPDGDSITISLDSSIFISFDSSIIEVNTEAQLENDTIKMATSYSSSGYYRFYLSASDGFLSTAQLFTLSVNNVNGPPVWADTAVIPAVDENMTVSFNTSAFVSDPDNDSLIIRLDSSTFEGNIITGALLTNDSIHLATNYISSGNYIFYLTASDDSFSIEKQFSLTVNNVEQRLFTAVEGGTEHTLILNCNNNLWATGKNYYGQLGDGTHNETSTPIFIFSNVKTVSAGYSHTMLLRNDTLWATGDNSFGQLGDGSNMAKSSYIPVMTDVKTVSAGMRYTLALKNNGELWTSGDNSYGQLGDGTSINRSNYQLVMQNVTSISAGDNHALILKSDTLFAAGYNSSGQLGDGTTENRPDPVQISTDVKAVSAGGNHSLILKNDNTLWVMGSNNYGQLGDSTKEDRLIPTLIMENVEAVSAGGVHSLILQNNSTLWVTGRNIHGQLGVGTTIDKSIPFKIMNDVKTASAGYYHSLIIKNDSTLWVTGKNSSGQLGDGMNNDRLDPFQLIF